MAWKAMAYFDVSLGLWCCDKLCVKTVLHTDERDSVMGEEGGRGLPAKMANRDKEEAEVCLCAR